MVIEYILVLFLTVSSEPMPETQYVIIADDNNAPISWQTAQVCRAFVATDFQTVIQTMRHEFGKRATVTPICLPVKREVI